jgi:hypothetical protein
MGSCEHSNESSGFIKEVEFLDQLSKILFLKDLFPWIINN